MNSTNTCGLCARIGTNDIDGPSAHSPDCLKTTLVAVRTATDGGVEVYDVASGEMLARGESIYRARDVRDAIVARADEYRKLLAIHFVDARSFVLHEIIPQLRIDKWTH